MVILNQSSENQLDPQKEIDMHDHLAFKFGGSNYHQLSDKIKEFNTDSKVKMKEGDPSNSSSREVSNDSKSPKTSTAENA